MSDPEWSWILLSSHKNTSSCLADNKSATKREKLGARVDITERVTLHIMTQSRIAGIPKCECRRKRYESHEHKYMCHP